MLPWQLLNVRKKYQIFIQLIIASLVVHIFFAGWLFFGYREPGSHLQLTVNHFFSPNDQDIILVSTLNPAFLNVSSRREILQRAPASSKPLNTSSNTVAKKRMSPPTVLKSVQSEKISTQKKAVGLPTKKVDKKEIKDSKPSLLAVTETKKLVETKKLIENKKEASIVSIPKEKIENSSALLPSVDKHVVITQHAQENGSLFMHATPQQIEAYRQQQLFHRILKKNWRPPVGVNKECVCQISFTVGWDGGIQNLVVDISSGILMYDIAARSALHSMAMPEWSRGKTLTISFRQ